jgi:hypothetical protein
MRLTGVGALQQRYGMFAAASRRVVYTTAAARRPATTGN